MAPRSCGRASNGSRCSAGFSAGVRPAGNAYPRPARWTYVSAPTRCTPSMKTYAPYGRQSSSNEFGSSERRTFRQPPRVFTTAQTPGTIVSAGTVGSGTSGVATGVGLGVAGTRGTINGAGEPRSPSSPGGKGAAAVTPGVATIRANPGVTTRVAVGGIAVAGLTGVAGVVPEATAGDAGVVAALLLVSPRCPLQPAISTVISSVAA